MGQEHVEKQMGTVDSIPVHADIDLASIVYTFSGDSRPPEDEYLPLYRFGCRMYEEQDMSIGTIQFCQSSGGVCKPISGTEQAAEVRDRRAEILADEPYHLIVAAGGMGTRMDDLTTHVPKPLLRVNGTPMLSRLVRVFDRCPDLARTTVLIREGVEDYRQEFVNWRRDFPDVGLLDQANTETSRALISAAMRSDQQLALIASGDKWINIPPRDMPAILQSVREKLVDFPITLVGKFVQSARRRVVVDEDGRIRSFRKSTLDNPGLETLDAGFGVVMMAVDCGRLPIVMSSCGEKAGGLISLLLKNDIPVGVLEIDDDHSWINVNTPELLDKAAKQVSVDQCLYTPDKILKGGRSGAEVDVIHTEGGERHVRKSRRGGVPVNIRGTERDAYMIDSVMFNGGARLVESHHCNYCPDKRCAVMQYHDGPTVDALINRADTEQAHDIRMNLVRSMRRGGYFDQRHYGSTDDMWQIWSLNRMDLFDALVRDEADVDGLIAVDLPDTSHRVIAYLTESKARVPRGFFPRDLNPGNIILRSDGEIVTIDQTSIFGSPAIVAAKLLFGWRGMIRDGQAVQDDELEERIAQVLRMDHEFLSEFAGYYDGEDTFPDVVRQIGGCMILRHHRGVLDIVKKYGSSQEDVLSIALPFILRDKQMFESGRIQ